MKRGGLGNVAGVRRWLVSHRRLEGGKVSPATVYKGRLVAGSAIVLDRCNSISYPLHDETLAEFKPMPLLSERRPSRTNLSCQRQNRPGGLLTSRRLHFDTEIQPIHLAKPQ